MTIADTFTAIRFFPDALRARRKYNCWFFEYGPRPQGYRGRHRRRPHEGATATSVPLRELMPAQGVLREDEANEALAYIEAEAEQLCKEAAARGNDTREDVLDGIDPEIHKANKPLFEAMLADFDTAFNAIVDRFNNEPQAPRRVLIAAEHTQEFDIIAIRDFAHKALAA